MVLRLVASDFPENKSHFCCIQGYLALLVLHAILHDYVSVECKGTVGWVVVEI